MFEIALLLAFPLFIFIVFEIRGSFIDKETQRLKKEEELRRKEEELRRKQRQHIESQQAIHNRLVDLIDQAKSILCRLPKEILAAERSLKEAENEFAEGAFAPFWDAIQNAATSLARFDSMLQQVTHHSERYKTDLKLIDEAVLKPPQFDLQFGILPDVSQTANRLRALVRLGQKDFHFATIYEQRKTNNILVEGFSNLGQAINDMGYLLNNSLTTLSSSVSDLAEKYEYNSKDLLAGIRSLKEQIRSDEEARREHERIEREMLNNIQRRRKPA